jgi:hypothetical protein
MRSSSYCCLRLFLVTFLLVTPLGFGQEAQSDVPAGVSQFEFYPDGLSLPEFDASLLPHPPMPLMSPEIALVTFQHRGQQQTAELPSYTDETLVVAELPETAQRAAFELQRFYVAPRSLSYKPIHFTGDSFVKSNVIARVLQSEVDFVQKGDPSQVALNDANYKFSYKGLQSLDGHSVHLYQVKPRVKRVGLFKGRLYLDAHNGTVVRTEGSLAKSPSFFVRKLEFVQDYAAVGRYTLPVHLHSTAQARLVGRAVVDVYHRAYQIQDATASLIVPSALPDGR